MEQSEIMDIDDFKKEKLVNEFLECDISNMIDLITIKNVIVSVLTDDLLKPQYRKGISGKKPKTFGHCYAASEALYYLTGGKENWTPQQGKCDTLGSHWWLKNKSSGKLVDVTDEQFFSLNLIPPYNVGKGRGFQNQSFRSLDIINRTLKKLKIPHNILRIKQN